MGGGGDEHIRGVETGGGGAWGEEWETDAGETDQTDLYGEKLVEEAEEEEE